MALINCPECGKEVSDSAITCPHCGYGLKREKIKTKMNLSSGNISSKITATNAVALIAQIVLFAFLFFDMIRVTISHDVSDTSNYSIAKLSFTNICKKVVGEINPDYSGSFDNTCGYIHRGNYSGAQMGFIILLILFLIVIGMMIFEFVKNKLLINGAISAVIILITEIYAIVFYNKLAHINASYGDISWEDDYEVTSSGLTLGAIFITLCIVVCLIKLINYWLHRENKTESMKNIPLNKIFNKSKSSKENN